MGWWADFKAKYGPGSDWWDGVLPDFRDYARRCPACGEPVEVQVWGSRFDPMTGERLRETSEAKCPRYETIAPESEYGYGNGHYVRARGTRPARA